MASSEIINKLKIKAYRWDIPLFVEKELGNYYIWKDADYGKKLSRQQRDFLSKQVHLEENRTIIVAGRGNGKTISAAILAIWSATVLAEDLKHPYEVCILGGSYKQSQGLYDYIRAFINCSPWIASKVKGEPLKSETKFKNGAIIRALKASEAQIRGLHPDCLCLDEAAMIPRDLVKAAIPSLAVSKYPRLIQTSTPQVHDSDFVDLMRDPQKEGYTLYHWTALKCPFISKEQVALARIKFERGEDVRTWKEEYLGEVSLGSTLIKDEDIKSCIVDERPTPDFEAHTIGGIDWGREHPTALIIIQQHGKMYYVIEAREWRHKKFLWIQEQVKDLYARYGIDTLYSDASHPGVNENLVADGLHVKDMSFSGGAGGGKAKMVTKMCLMFEKNLIKIPRSLKMFDKVYTELTRYTETTKDKDDLVDALMLALNGAKNPSDDFLKGDKMWACGRTGAKNVLDGVIRKKDAAKELIAKVSR